VIDALGAPRRILLLGGTSEIGLAIVRRLVPAGRDCEVVLAGRDAAALARAGEQLGGTRTRVRAVTFDALERSGHRAAVDDAWSAGDVDVVVVAFGVLGQQDALLADPEAAARLMEVNVTAAVSVGLHVAQRLRMQGHGRLLALSSIAAVRARPDNFVYGASKAGFDAFFDGLAHELTPYGVHVSVLRPGFVTTRMTAGLTPAPLATGPEAVAEAALRALDHPGPAYVSLPQRLVGTALQAVPRRLLSRLKG
jgi:decaprenylphospho-beta-D-erythro-pentofuranosid-2-ulose 2-reductase